MKFLSALVAAAAVLPTALAADAEAWKSRSIYFVLTDRVARNSGDTGGGACGNLGNYCGGTFAGLQGKLQYIKDLGFDAIWLTPVVANTPGGYHGYWASDLYGINANYGTADEFKSLVNAAHDMGIWIMADVVANHMGDGDISTFNPPPLNDPASYHPSCEINYDDQNSVEQCEIANLPDIDTENPTVAQALNEWIAWFVEEYNLDGLRIDTVKHVSKNFWPDFAHASGVYTVGEVWDGGVDYLSGYDNLMGGLLDYATYYPMNRFYQQTGSSKDLANMVDQVGNTFSNPAALASFLDNHDNARWLNVKNEHALFKNALAFVILSRGIPIVYYGSEQGYAGGNDPQNREDLWRSNFNKDHDLYQSIKRLNAARAAHGGLPGDDHVNLHAEKNGYAWSRAGGDLIVLTTNFGGSWTSEYCFITGRANGSWEDVFGSGTYSSDASGNVCVQVTKGQPVVLSAA